MFFRKKLNLNTIPSTMPGLIKATSGELELSSGEIYLNNNQELPEKLRSLFVSEQILEILIDGNSLTFKVKGEYDEKELIGLFTKVFAKNFKVSALCLDPYLEKPAKEISTENKVAAPAQAPEEDTSSSLPIYEIQSFIDERVTPALAAHGGHMKILREKEGVLEVEFGGGCQGCSQINVTVKQGVEKLLKENFPTIKAIYDKTDHDAGDNPFYK